MAHLLVEKKFWLDETPPGLGFQIRGAI